MTFVILFVFGAIVGSFLNVVALRWDRFGRGRIFSNINGRSKCPSCRKVLSAWELIPIVSFIALRARCRECRASISYQYPIMEIWTGLVFATVPVYLLPIFSIYIVIAAYDFRHKIIPDFLVYSSIIIGLVAAFSSGNYGLYDWLAGPVIFAFFASIWLISRGRAMGFGDAKLGLSVGIALGPVLGISAIVLSFWIGAAVSLVILGLCKAGFLKGMKGLTIKSEIPFAPFIILGAWVSVIFQLNLLNVPLL